MYIILTTDETVDLSQSNVVMVDVAVFEQAPELQVGQPNNVMRGVDSAKSAVEHVDGPELCTVRQHHIVHLL